jgi:hypothetical protein
MGAKVTEELTLRDHLTSISRKGGVSRSKKKLEAAKRNIRRALHARMPTDPRWIEEGEFLAKKRPTERAKSTP